MFKDKNEFIILVSITLKNLISLQFYKMSLNSCTATTDLIKKIYRSVVSYIRVCHTNSFVSTDHKYLWNRPEFLSIIFFNRGAQCELK